MFSTPSKATTAAVLTLAVGALCLMLGPVLPWLIDWPAAWTLPATRWIGTAVTAGLDVIKPLARALARLLGYPMQAATWALVTMPYPLTIALTAALALWLSGWRMALGAGGWPRLRPRLRLLE